MSAKQPTAQGISRLLGAVGFEKSESSATRIKGWRNSSEGFEARKDHYTGGVEVAHRTGYDRGEAGRARRTEMLGRYAEAIRAAGWNVTASERGIGDTITVTAKSEQED